MEVEALLRIMVFKRLCDPASKLGVLRWLETVTLPGLALKVVSHHQLLRAMDALLDHHEAVEQTVAGWLRPLVDQDLSVVFYDMTTIRAAGLSEQDQRYPQIRHEQGRVNCTAIHARRRANGGRTTAVSRGV